MADHSVAGFIPLYHDPGNPEFPVLPDGVPSIHLIEFHGNGSLHARGPQSHELEKLSVQGRASTFTDQFLDGIWRTPNPVDFGNITATKTRTVNLHNTNRSAVTLTAIDVSAVAGLTVVSPGLPIVIEAFSSQLVTFEVTTIGDPNFDAEVVFTVGGAALSVRMFGRRVIIFNTLPQRPMLERLTWLTDNMISVNGKEQAFALRAAPRSQVTVDQRITDDEERTRQQTRFLGAGFLRQGAQLWWQSRPISASALSTDTVIQCDTENMEIESGKEVSFVTPAGIAVEGEVSSFDPTSITLNQEVGLALPLNTSVMPLKFGFLTNNARLASFPLNAEDMRLVFNLIEYSDIGAIDMAYFDTHPVDGLPVITHPLYFSGSSRAAQLTQDLTVLDSQTGDINYDRDELIGRIGQEILVRCQSMADQHAWRRFLHFVRGSWGRFYVPTGTNDLPLSAGLSLGGNTFTVPSMGIANLLGNVAPRRDLWLDVNGTVYYRRITNVTDNGTDETITLSSVIPGAGTVDAENVRVSWLALSRIVGDVATFRHLRRGESELRFNIRGVIEA